MQTVAVSAASTSIALALCFAMMDRYLARRKTHELFWAIALGMFAIAAFALTLGAGAGWNPGLFRVFFYFGAIANVPILALGSLTLAKGNILWINRVVAAACLFAAGVVAASPLTGQLNDNELPKGSEVFGVLPRVLAALCSGLGATAVIVLAIAGALRASKPTRRAGNLMIGLGTLVAGASGLLNSALGEMEAFAVTLCIGISLIFVGFMLATSEEAKPDRTTNAAMALDQSRTTNLS